MIQIDDKVISLDVFCKKYVCDLSKCKGECCVEGDSGAPLDDDETAILEDIYPTVEPYLPPASRAEVERQGKWVVDSDGDKVTPIINGRECVYAYRDADVACKCAIEKAYLDGRITCRKPISCHLYPIRVTRYRDFEALNYHEWFVCKPARELGRHVGTPVYEFLREPIIRKYGEAFYAEMQEAARAIERDLKHRD